MVLDPNAASFLSRAWILLPLNIRWSQTTDPGPPNNGVPLPPDWLWHEEENFYMQLALVVYAPSRNKNSDWTSIHNSEWRKCNVSCKRRHCTASREARPKVGRSSSYYPTITLLSKEHGVPAFLPHQILLACYPGTHVRFSDLHDAQLTSKSYPDHDGVDAQLMQSTSGDTSTQMLPKTALGS
jgi:hypothetical protein